MRSWLTKPFSRILALFLLLLLLRVPFYITHHVQEDAYISLRCAENLAQTGVYGFNTEERVSSSTAHLYVFLAALIRLIVGHAAYIPAVLVLNTMLFLGGTWFLARVMLKEENKAVLLWVLISSLPISLLISYSGMETSLLVFLIGLILFLLQRGGLPWAAWVGLTLLPWVRPDAIAYGALILFWYSLKNKKIAWSGVGSLIAGSLAMLLFNQLYFGSLLQQSITAKLLMRHSFTLKGFLQNLSTVFISQADGGIFSPIRTKYFGPLSVLFLLITLAAMFFYFQRNRSDDSLRWAGFVVASMALVVPLAYAFGGVLYQWYFWPCSMFGYIFLLSLLVDWMTGEGVASRLLRWGLVLLFFSGVAVQWAYSYAWGVKEFAYRGGIGAWLKENAKKNDRLLLEPAGYIPYYSGLYAYDEVGLVSPQVVNYRQAYDLRWWPEFVSDFKPDWIVQRSQITRYKTYQGYELNPEERQWFQQNYQLVARFTFNPADFTESPLLTRLLALGEADDYYVFHVIR